MPDKEKVKLKENKLSTLLKNDGLKFFVMFCFYGLNIFIVIFHYFKLRNNPAYNYIYLMGGPNLMASRAFGAGLNFNCLLILLPMNKTINSWIRTHILTYFSATPRRVFDHTKGFHITCAYVIALYSLAHTVLHLVNAFLFHENFTTVVPGINVFATREGTTVAAFLRTVPGWTGLLLLIILAIVFITSFKGVRRQSFEGFLFTHQLALAFLVIMCVHGLGNVTKRQTNLDQHPIPCHNLTHIVKLPECKARPTFEHKGVVTWKWLLAPLLLHFLERCIRYIRSFKNCRLVKIAVHDGSVVELLMYKKTFSAKAGQYIRVNIPEISDFQWHAFTLTKTPTGPTFEEKTFSVHIKACGGWTQNLLQLATERIESHKKKGDIKRVGESCLVTITDDVKLPLVRVDGPYGSPNQDGFRYDVNVSIAAGIGITPYACMLNALKYHNPDTNVYHKNLKKMYLVWACRGIKDFNWLVKLMFEVETRLAEIGHPDFLECILHVTQGYKADAKDAEATTDSKANDIGAWLKKKMVGGRPKFKEILTNIGSNYEKKDIGVFFCGPPVLGTFLEEECSSITVRGNQYLFHKESFG